jgi:hypothetical protein
MGVCDLCGGGMCVGVCICVEVVYAGQANVVRGSLWVGSESEIILAIKN